jgi:parallel beta-helix repeat protein
MIKVLLLFLIIGGTIEGGGIAAQPNPITSCMVIDTPGNYTLTRNIQDSDAPICIDIQIRNYGIVEIDGHDHTIDGIDAPGSIGIGFANEMDGRMVIRDVKVSDWDRGISGKGNYGSFVYDSNIESCDIGFTSPGDYPYQIERNMVRENRLGLLLGSAHGSVVSNKITDNEEAGIELVLESGRIINNYFSNKVNVGGSLHPMILSLSSILLEKNVINRNQMGGNFWGNPSGTGYSERCADTDKNKICDSPYTLWIGATDYFPLAK